MPWWNSEALRNSSGRKKDGRVTPAFFKCQRCDKKFPNTFWVAERKFCSRECYFAAGGAVRDPAVRKQISHSRVGWPAARRGKDHHFWKGGRPGETPSKERSRKYRHRTEKWRRAVFMRDGYECQHCSKPGNKDYGSKGIGLEAAHIVPWFKNRRLWFAVSNGITLCRPCHDAFDVANGHRGRRVG